MSESQCYSDKKSDNKISRTNPCRNIITICFLMFLMGIFYVSSKNGAYPIPDEYEWKNKIQNKQLSKIFPAMIFYKKISTRNEYLNKDKCIENKGCKNMIRYICMISMKKPTIRKIRIITVCISYDHKDNTQYNPWDKNFFWYLHIEGIIKYIYPRHESPKYQNPKTHIVEIKLPTHPYPRHNSKDHPHSNLHNEIAPRYQGATKVTPSFLDEVRYNRNQIVPMEYVMTRRTFTATRPDATFSFFPTINKNT